jgi:beta-galactosidase
MRIGRRAPSQGVYHQTLDQQYYPYARPQESGNHGGVRWVSFSDGKGTTLRFLHADSLLNFSALPYNMDDLDPGPEKKQYHSGELAPFAGSISFTAAISAASSKPHSA